MLNNKSSLWQASEASKTTNAIVDENTTMTTSIVCVDNEMSDAVENVDDEVITMKMAANDINEFGGGKKRKRIIKKEK